MSAEYEAACEIRDAITDLTSEIGRQRSYPDPLQRWRAESVTVRVTVEGGVQLDGRMEDFGAEYGGWITLQQRNRTELTLVPWHRIVLIQPLEAGE